MGTARARVIARPLQPCSPSTMLMRAGDAPSGIRIPPRRPRSAPEAGAPAPAPRPPATRHSVARVPRAHARLEDPVDRPQAPQIGLRADADAEPGEDGGAESRGLDHLRPVDGGAEDVGLQLHSASAPSASIDSSPPGTSAVAVFSTSALGIHALRSRWHAPSATSHSAETPWPVAYSGVSA